MLPAGARWRPAGSGRAPPVERLVTVWVLTRRRARRAPAEPPPRARACCRPRPVPPGLLAARLNAFVRLPVRPAQTTALAVAIPAYQAEPEPWHVEVSMPCARVAPTLLHAGWTHAPRPAWLTAAGSRLSRTGCRRLPPDHVRQHDEYRHEIRSKVWLVNVLRVVAGGGQTRKRACRALLICLRANEGDFQRSNLRAPCGEERREGMGKRGSGEIVPCGSSVFIKKNGTSASQGRVVR